MKQTRPQQLWYHWYYHPELRFLLVCPGDLMITYPSLWPKILSTCGLPPWSSFLSHDHARFIPSQEGVKLLIQNFNPELSWFMAYPKQALPISLTTPMLETPADLTNGKTKKEIWLKWMAQK